MGKSTGFGITGSSAACTPSSCVDLGKLLSLNLIFLICKMGLSACLPDDGGVRCQCLARVSIVTSPEACSAQRRMLGELSRRLRVWQELWWDGGQTIQPGAPAPAISHVRPTTLMLWASVGIHSSAWMKRAVVRREGPAGLQMQARLLHERTQGESLLALRPPLPAPDLGSATLPVRPSNIQSRRCWNDGPGKVAPPGLQVSQPSMRLICRPACGRPGSLYPLLSSPFLF